MEKFIFERIVAKRIAKGLSKADLARACDISPTAYANIERGDMNSISLDVAKGIAKALDQNFYELFDIELPIDTVFAANLIEENKNLKKIIANLKEEQLNDKKDIIDLLSDNKLLLAVSAGIEYQTDDYFTRRDKNLELAHKGIFDIDNDRPFDKDSPESMKEYITKNLKFGKRNQE